MGFWSALGGVVGSAAKGMADSNRESKELSEVWSSHGDSFLVGKASSGSSMAEKTAAHRVLRERYPDADERQSVIKAHM